MFLIGAQKAGTTSLFNAYINSPDVRTDVEFKDYHIFDDSLMHAGKHQKHVLRDGAEVALLHAGVNYMYMPAAMHNIASRVEHVELLVCLRNPVDRAVSAYNYFKQLGLESRSLNDTMKAELCAPRSLTDLDRSYLLQGLYYDALKTNVFPAVPRERVRVLVFEEVFDKGSINLAPVNKILGVDYVDSMKLQSNAKSGVRFSRFNKLLFSRNAVKSTFSSILPVSLRYQIRETLAKLNKIPIGDRVILEPEIRKEMLRFFRDDVAQLSDEMAIDFVNKWK